MNSGLCEFIQASPTPFHAVDSMAKLLELAGFQRLREQDAWQLALNQSYYVTRNDSSLIAFRTGSGALLEQGIRMVGAHTDSPCLKVKPRAELQQHGYAQLGVEVYGGALLNPWFDRDLSLAGRVSFSRENGAVESALVNIERAIAVVPSLAIHLDREANQNRSINAQQHLPPVLMQVTADSTERGAKVGAKKGAKQGLSMLDNLLLEMLEQSGVSGVKKVLAHELCFYDVNPPAVVGINNEFLASARLDNLLSCYVGMDSIIRSEAGRCSLLVCNDHEEVGSLSAAGAQGPFLEAVLERISDQLTPADSAAEQRENFRRVMHSSMMVSADNAHGIHPNYADKHDAQHGPLLNAGPVIKVNANQRYATSDITAALFRHLCEQSDVPVQSFVVRSDMGCGSTIGPAVAAELGVQTLDVGVPTFAMHSIREMAGTRDVDYLGRALRNYYGL